MQADAPASVRHPQAASSGAYLCATSAACISVVYCKIPLVEALADCALSTSFGEICRTDAGYIHLFKTRLFWVLLYLPLTESAPWRGAQAYRRQKLQALIVLAAMERRVARLQERLCALRKQRLEDLCADAQAATQPEQ